MARAIYIPDNLALPNEPLFKRHREDAYYFCHLLFRQRIFNRRQRDEYIPIKMQYLKRQINQGTIKPMLQALIKAGIVETDGHYIKGRKSKGYRLRQDLRHAPHRRYLLTNKLLLKRLAKWHQDEDRHQAETETHIGLKQAFRRLKLDTHQARTQAEKLYQDTIAAIKGLKDKNRYRKQRKAKLQYLCNLQSIDAWEHGDHYLVADDYGRIHTNLTNLSSRLRSYLSLDNGESLWEIDLVNSQPLIFAALVLSYLLNEYQSFTKHTLILTSTLPSTPRLYDANFQSKLKVSPKYKLKYQIQAMNQTSLVQGVGLLTGNLPDDAIEYIRLCETGRLYETLMETTGQERSQVKRSFFKAMFSRSVPDWFRERFPTIALAADYAKRHDYRQLSHLLQRGEGSIILNGVATSLLQANRFVATIHDSLVVTKRDLRLTIRLLEQEFHQWNLSPAVSVKRITAKSTANLAVTSLSRPNG